MSSTDSSWLSFWDWFASIGFILVIIGCIIEGVEHFVKFKRTEAQRRKGIEKLGWLILVGGLAMEFLGDNRAKRVSNRENKRLANEAEQARRDSSKAIERASSNDLQVAVLTSNNLILLSNVLVLEAKLKPRIITNTQITNFIFLTQRITKVPVKIIAVTGSLSYAGQIRSMLTDGGFGTADANTSRGITLYLDRALVRPPGQSYEWPPIVFLHYGTNAVALPRWGMEFTNGFARPITVTGSPDEIIEGLMAAFIQIGIPSTNVWSNTNWIKEGQIGIFVPDKND